MDCPYCVCVGIYVCVCLGECVCAYLSILHVCVCALRVCLSGGSLRRTINLSPGSRQWCPLVALRPSGCVCVTLMAAAYVITNLIWMIGRQAEEIDDGGEAQGGMGGGGRERGRERGREH